MRKIYKVIGGMLLAGVLITGIGSGVAFAEYSSFEYGGEKYPAGIKSYTKTIDYVVDPEGLVTKESTLKKMQEMGRDIEQEEYEVEEDGTLKKPIQFVENSWCTNLSVVEDENVSKDTIQFVMKYHVMNEPEPKVEEEIENCQGESVRVLYMYNAWGNNDLQTAMQVKDMILDDLKSGKISDYKGESCTMELHVNPKAKFKVHFAY